MKLRTLASSLVVCLFALALYAAENPNMGTWKLNEAKSKIPAGAGKNTAVVYSAAANDMIKVTTDGKGKMPSYKGKLTDDQIKAAVEFYRSLGK